MKAPSLEAVEISGVFLGAQSAVGNHLTCAPSNFQRMTLTGLTVRERVSWRRVRPFDVTPDC
jgi:hypothetical protein